MFGSTQVAAPDAGAPGTLCAAALHRASGWLPDVAKAAPCEGAELGESVWSAGAAVLFSELRPFVVAICE